MDGCLHGTPNSLVANPYFIGLLVMAATAERRRRGLDATWEISMQGEAKGDAAADLHG
jgi:hypothetical protein